MENKDFLSSEEGDINSLYKKYAMRAFININERFDISFLAWLIACFSLFANLTLIVMIYVNPILTETTTICINIAFIFVLFVCLLAVYLVDWLENITF